MFMTVPWCTASVVPQEPKVAEGGIDAPTLAGYVSARDPSLEFRSERKLELWMDMDRAIYAA